ncbi:MAG TPA: hypothetical protein VK530_21390 [Candidatus Acidoferrum sp.]|nr:hypothetical protein [Candidatus Acidoferrum sp.]
MTVEGTAAHSAKRFSSLALWFCAFCSPTAYCLLLLGVHRLQLHPPPAIVIVLLFFLISVVALLVCERVAWSSSQTRARRIAWMLFTLVAMLLQVGVLLGIVLVAIQAAIGYAQ